MAEAIIARLDIESFIRSWNTGSGSIIISYGSLLDALAFKPDRLAAFESAMEEAAVDGCENLDSTLCALLEPLILSTAMIAILKVCDDWAEEITAAGPEIVVETRPFSGAQDFIDWAVARDEPPAELCGPNGEEILNNETIKTLLRRALSVATANAQRVDWLRAES
ncbi:hypothetical protein [Methylobacterium sp. WL9]|uniref:hypothetical protein n=1 Tax=Methylobacterium sp. WL9 TaxID=2603898 RepID=UPI0011D69B57|nr:hypothetical protein [Methylobacterium sp. WL9]TXN22862.1 hypothetical protein FV217_09075 [Methylobacterium sp. WL9]